MLVVRWSFENRSVDGFRRFRSISLIIILPSAEGRNVLEAFMCVSFLHSFQSAHLLPKPLLPLARDGIGMVVRTVEEKT